jgi:uncharacterized repeat protein (TIGR01451 family)
VGQNFVHTITVDNLGPATVTGILVFDTWTAGLAMFISVNNPACAPFAANQVGCNIGSLTAAQAPVSIQVTLRATSAGTLRNDVSIDFPSPPTDPNPGNDSASLTTRILAALTPTPSSPPELAYRSRMEVEPGRGAARGHIVLNGSVFQETDSSGEFVYTARAREGVNRIETQADLSEGASGSWRFDFGGSRDFVPGSLRVEAGRVVAQDGFSITFGLGSGTGAPRFTFQMGEGRRAPAFAPGHP